ncbi:hypothetical protein cypCar_00036500 [Cyprinus carpio]|nr:hypothetical protein cypCar_00036500 [Cyprinus carpio]
MLCAFKQITSCQLRDCAWNTLFGIILFVYSNIKLTLGASVVLQCNGTRQNDGQFLFVILYNIKEYFSDCEKQWLVNGTLTGLFEEGNPSFISPITNLTASTATLQACPENLECLLSCPTGKINEKQLCSCDISTPTSLSEGQDLALVFQFLLNRLFYSGKAIVNGCSVAFNNPLNNLLCHPGFSYSPDSTYFFTTKRSRLKISCKTSLESLASTS